MIEKGILILKQQYKKMTTYNTTGCLGKVPESFTIYFRCGAVKTPMGKAVPQGRLFGYAGF